ncbi:hypothetical protein CASFOL_021447 [Castilleja foliolosa]|uniref:Protein NO VEIN C-terminal domain-containing protein n=1 Tax=Castilleja foliolosa TaxID=1961234 RepID=A0ABD3CWK4_9LAMI
MYGQSPPSRPGGGGGGRGRGVAQPQGQQQSLPNTNIFPTPNFFLQQNPSFFPHLNPYLQNPTSFHQFQQQKKTVEEVDKAAMGAWRELVELNENVSAWKVSNAALLKVKADSWRSLGYDMHQVPSLSRLLAIEQKIHTFIDCFVAVRRITSLYDLEVAICKSEGVKRFEDLELGPLLRHPHVVHCFSLNPDLTEIYRITTEEIISCLCEFIDTHKKKELKADIFLDFVSKKMSVNGREKLCVRVKQLGEYINHIKRVRQSEDRVLEKCYEKMRTRFVKRSKKRPLFSAQKQELDDHFTAISERLKSFSSENTQFCGRHIRFASSSSDDDDDSEDNEYKNNQDEKNTENNCSVSLPTATSDRVSNSRCPYPSATEEMTRLGLKSELESGSYTPAGGTRSNAHNELSQKKRRCRNTSSSTFLPRKLQKYDKFDENLKNKGSDNQATGGHSISTESLKMFFTTWKEACHVNDVNEVLERMLQFYNTRSKGKVKEMFTSYPFVGLLYAAVTCIRSGMGDNMYDTFQTLSQQGTDGKPFESSADYISIDVEPVKKDVAEPVKKDVSVSAQQPLMHKHDVRAEDVANKISGYLVDGILSYKNTSRESKFRFLRMLYKCENWLTEQYSINKFESLGYGEYLLFIEKHMHLLPQALQKCIMGDMSENVSLEAHLLPIQLEVLLSQALNGLQENQIINIRNVSELLAKQFPLVCFKLMNSDLKTNCSNILREKKCSLSSNSILFSIPLSRLNDVCDSAAQNDKQAEETSEFSHNTTTKEGMVATVTTKDAIEAILGAPMMTDLNMWLHWDILFAPSLGSIVVWLLKEADAKELMCLITKDGKVFRIDHSATVDSFLKVFIRGSSFETTVQLLSLIAIYGGVQNVPVSLLKCHARQAFEVIINNYLQMELYNDKNPLMHGNPSSDHHIVGESTPSNLISKLPNNRSILSKAAPVMARFILECLSYLPIEFCSFAADVLIAGLQSFVSNVPAAILTECKNIKQRLMLHEVGMSLGLMEWVNDYQSFHSSAKTGFSSELSCDVVNSALNTRSVVGQGEREKSLSAGKKLVSCDVDRLALTNQQARGGSANSGRIPALNNHIGNDPAGIIELIRQDEFGLDQSLSLIENNMLKKQHARLGRALHCLSQELYSQDSHFLLELVQNADDNSYPENVEPTLSFILQEEGIIVLNNEVGFSANNIRALCDVGNSTKKGQSAGYIGKKGIGFKSVFRVTDAPEIHSNGFHIKFDITEGQIGFVLPTVVPPCDIDLYTRLASADDDQMDLNTWNTCVVLPFRSNLLEGFAMNNILSMFSDLHPSLLLFLHRLQCITFRNLLDHSLIVMRKEVIGDGIVEVALGNEKMTWFVVSQKLRADVIRSDVQTTEISIAFTLQETSEGGYVPILNQQPVFAFLPLRTYGLKFILQGDFVLPSSREEVDGNSPWNQWLLSEFPDVFVSAQRSFCALPCYGGSFGKAITVFMSFVPLVGEVHGFFSSLPRMIISKLRMSSCLILEGDEIEWVPPCKVLRNWTEQTRSLLPDSLLRQHLGLGFLNKDIVLSDSLAKTLGVEDYGPKTLLRVITSLCHSDNGLKSMGLSWLCSWLSAIYVVSSQSFMQTSTSLLTESDFILNLQKTAFIPLSDGKYSSLDEGTIWLHSEVNDECLLEAFPRLYTKLRIVSPDLLAAANSIASSCSDTDIVDNVTRMLYRVGVQRLSIHDVVKVHILPAISDDRNATGQKELMIEYLAFAMFHLQSSCTTCSLERGSIIAEFREKALILTNYGFKRSSEVPIHFSQIFGNLFDVNRLIAGMDMRWHEIDTAYVKHSITKSISDGVVKWRTFLNEIGITDFVQVVQVEKSVPDVSPANSKDAVHVKDIMSTDLIAKNWESEELFHLLSWLSTKDDWEKSKYLLEILDTLWDDYFSDKVTGYYNGSAGDRRSFKSSFITILQDFPWVASNINSKLHYPKALFHDCTAVNSVLGVSAPYTIPKVRSEKMLADIGFKTQVTLDDALSVLRLWTELESPFKASLSQMSNFYSFLWKGMALSKKKVQEELHSRPFIFVPSTSSYSEDAVVSGVLLSPQEVYWHDTIGTVDQIKSVHPECVPSIASPQRKMLYNFYPNLHDFFVNECGVDERPPLCSYLQILLQLSNTVLPHQAAKTVCEVLLIWDDAMKSGLLSSEDVKYLSESLQKKEYAVLPTRLDKWVSLNSSFGLICWRDDDDLGKEFRQLGGVDFLYFGESTDEEYQMLRPKVSTIVQRLGIPAITEIVTREPVYYGSADCTFVFSLVKWVLPYAQRYIYNAHPDKYSQLKQSDFENIKQLKIVVVEKLFYRNVIKKHEITSRKRHKCNCLLQDNILYCSLESDTHTVFLELSRLLLSQNPDLHFANFLHMIKTMAESGATEEQTEFFILNSQKVPKLPADECIWSLQSVSSSNDSTVLKNSLSVNPEEQSSSVKKRPGINSSWPPVDWKTAPGFHSVKIKSKKTRASSCPQTSDDKNSVEENVEQSDIPPTEIGSEMNIDIDPTSTTQGAVLLEPDISEPQPNVLSNLVAPPSMNFALDSSELDLPDMKMFVHSNRTGTGQVSAQQQQAMLTGRIGENVAFRYFVEKVGDVFVKWVNETNETGLPYDIVLGGDDENSREYVEVKATKSGRKNWFLISMREWQFAVEKGEAFSIAHVVLADNNMAKVTVYKNPARLCQLGNLRLAVVVPKE